MKSLIGSTDLLFITLDTLRYDAAQHAWQMGQLTTLAPYLSAAGWQKRHTPASFTYAAHQAFFAGFLPTPTTPGPHPRRFAAKFAGSVSTTDDTFVFAEATLPEAL
ncbi:MAG: metalloenzyme domain-containing protein, partial [Chthoniobacteraceae bacterium]